MVRRERIYIRDRPRRRDAETNSGFSVNGMPSLPHENNINTGPSQDRIFSPMHRCRRQDSWFL